MKRKVNRNFLNLTNNANCDRLVKQGDWCGTFLNNSNKIIVGCTKGLEKNEKKINNFIADAIGANSLNNDKTSKEISNAIIANIQTIANDFVNTISLVKENGNLVKMGPVKKLINKKVKEIRKNINDIICPALCNSNYTTNECNGTCLKNKSFNDPDIITLEGGTRLAICSFGRNTIEIDIREKANTIVEDQLSKIEAKIANNGCVTFKSRKFKKKKRNKK